MIVIANTKTTKVAHWRWNVFNERQRENTGERWWQSSWSFSRYKVRAGEYVSPMNAGIAAAVFVAGMSALTGKS
jgi:hypothetical protein